MKNYRAKVRLEPHAGVDISDAIEEAIKIAGKVGVLVSFRFNGIEVVVDCESDVEQKYNEYMSELKSS